MPFIGKNPTAGFSSIVKDDFTPNGITTQFTLSKQVASATDIAVFVGNVRQEPTTAYTVNGTTLDFGSGNAPANGLDMYVLHIAGTLESSVIPADNTISSAKIAAGAVTDAKISGMTSSKLTGALPAISGSALTGIETITYTTPVSLAGGYNNKTFTGIPSTAKLIRVIWSGVTPGSGYPEWRLGNSSAMITSGYYNLQYYDYAVAGGTGDSQATYGNNVNSFRMPNWANANNNWYGWWDFVKNDQTDGNVFWHQTSHIYNAYYTDYGSFNIVGFVIAGSANPVDRYYFGSANGTNLTAGTIQVGYAV